jgi:hypothetical protein
MDMTYHVQGIVVGLLLNDRVGSTGVHTVVKIRDASGNDWDCPWGLDPNLPAIGDKMVLGCKVVS